MCINFLIFPEESSLINSFSSVGSYNIREGSKDSTAASTNDSTAVLPDSSRADSGNSIDDNGQVAVDTRQSTPRNGRFSSSENSSRCSNADTINSAISSRGADSLNSKNSGGSSISGQSSGSQRSSSKGENSSREELPNSRCGCEEVNTSGTKDQYQSKNLFSIPDDSTLSASCCSSFGIFQVEDEFIPLTPKTKHNEKPYKLQLETVSSSGAEQTNQIINSRRFSDGASPWDSNPLSTFSKKPQILENTWEMETEEPGYGFNFYTFCKQNALLQDESTSEDVGTESTTLEDVLDSLLALPSASRSPSPSSGGAHPLSRSEIQPTNFPTKEEKPRKTEAIKLDQPSKSEASRCDLDSVMEEDVRSTFLRNQDNGTDPKTQTYHKSFTSYTSSTFVPSKPAVLQTTYQSTFDSKNSDSLPTFDSEKSSVTFFLGKAEGETNE